MAEVLAPPMQSASPTPHSPLEPASSEPLSATTEYSTRARPRSHLSHTNSLRSTRHSMLSRQTSSRPQSSLYPFPSSLSYANVRDFAYPTYHPLHYGPPPDAASGTTTPGSEWASSRRLSDPLEAWNTNRGGNWGAGPWGGDGVMYADPPGDEGEALPATSFGEDADEDIASGFQPSKGKHRKSRSYTDITDLERGRRHESSSHSRRSRVSADGSEAFTTKLDPAGKDSLRQSRTYGNTKRMTGTLPSRSFHTSQVPESDNDEDPLPLDAEQSAHAHSPQRASMGPEDELYAGESLALYSFEPENPNELRLREGQVILVSYRHGQGWLVAEDPETGEQGLVPEEYVRLIREIESWDPERGGFIEDDSMTNEHTEHGDDDDVDVQQDTQDESSGSCDLLHKLPLLDDAHAADETVASGHATNKASESLEARQDSAHGEVQ